MAGPVHLAAIDAGSNALRLVIARAISLRNIEVLKTERASVRLGHNVFTRRVLDEETIARAARAFREFHRVMQRHGVTQYRAVATAAAREARNRRKLLDRIRRKAGIELEIISGAEEAQLVRRAVLSTLGSDCHPGLILDLGGGSLELNFMRGGEVEQSICLPLGVVRLMETSRIHGSVSAVQAGKLRQHVLELLRSAMASPPDLAGQIAVACGGNAEALAQIAPAPRLRGIPALNLRVLGGRIDQILARGVAERMKFFEVRRDRAEVMGVAAVVLTTLGEWLKMRTMLVPGVGVREGALLGMVEEQFGPARASEQQLREAKALVANAEWFARRFDYDAISAANVRRLAASMFDQLRPVHGLDAEMRVLLEVGAILHDIGYFIHRKNHHRHGDYILRNAEIPGLQGWRRDFVACLVRYHNTKSDPHPGHKLYHALDGARRRNVRLLTALLRMAERLDTEHDDGVLGVEIELVRRTAIFRIKMRNGARLDASGLDRRSGLFVREYQLNPAFRRVQLKEKVA